MRNLKTLSILALALAGALAVSSWAIAAKGGIPGPPSGGETANNLSLPGVQTESVNSIAHNWAVPAEPVLAYIDEDGDLVGHYSYGCDQPEGNEQFSYPNTSCVDDLDAPTVYYTAEECVAFEMPCEGFLSTELSRIYWQKVDVNEWWADDDGLGGQAEVAYVDWGDALEANTWTTKSKVRVETQPYSSTIPSFEPWVHTCETAALALTLDPAVACKVGFQMWHVSGQGITEHWGVRATDADAAISYNYDSPFQIIKTTTAQLDIAKMVPGDALCPQPGGNEGDLPPEVGAWTGSGWEGTCEVHDATYTVETSVGGKYVYGYNLDMKAANLCADWEKAGYYRLTFYTSGLDGAVQFQDPLAPNVAPPAVPSEVRELPRCDEYGNCVFNTVLAEPPPEIPPASVESEDPTADDRLYRPVVDTVNNLTYLDICIVAKDQGGGGGGGKGGGKKN